MQREQARRQALALAELGLELSESAERVRGVVRAVGEVSTLKQALDHIGAAEQALGSAEAALLVNVRLGDAPASGKR